MHSYHDKDRVSLYHIKKHGAFPNNEKLPVLLYKKAFHLLGNDEAEIIKKIFKNNNWKNSWDDGIYSYHHYHSNTHEALGVYSGTAKVLLGGEEEKSIEIEKGDVLILPAGVAHKRESASRNFKCVGAYPDGVSYDINYGKESELRGAEENIKKVPLPESDPVFGREGPLMEHWKKILV